MSERTALAGGRFRCSLDSLQSTLVNSPSKPPRPFVTGNQSIGQPGGFRHSIACPTGQHPVHAVVVITQVAGAYEQRTNAGPGA